MTERVPPMAPQRQRGVATRARREAGSKRASAARRWSVDLLGLLEANGTITPAMREAGRIFHAHFHAAALDPLRVAPLLRLPRDTGPAETERLVEGKRKVMAALDALGGPDSAAGSCVWHVVGCGASIREWAARRGWNGRPVGHAQAQGILVAALGVLAAHFAGRRARRPTGAPPAA